ncbi:hypothetical protein HHK36_025963 [Tetracentron sinense]|uniref:Protein FAR1-RELATED SEQUENCE n=1 Tax=Tetracentron sinense TaxID=13715 RepID=A0A834YJR6_TETSI|nr:hypothetical protein HHK36_025963 [Tetracentron sinense]
MESKKKVIPIFVDIKPSELHVMDFNGRFEVKELQRFRRALKEAKYTVGLTFDSSNGQYDNALENRYAIEVRADFETSSKYRTLKTSSMIEKQAAKAYTKTMFGLFDEQYLKSLDCLVFHKGHEAIRFAEEGVKNESLYEVALGYMDEAFKKMKMVNGKHDSSLLDMDSQETLT